MGGANGGGRGCIYNPCQPNKCAPKETTVRYARLYSLVVANFYRRVSYTLHRIRKSVPTLFPKETTVRHIALLHDRMHLVLFQHPQTHILANLQKSTHRHTSKSTSLHAPPAKDTHRRQPPNTYRSQLLVNLQHPHTHTQKTPTDVNLQHRTHTACSTAQYMSSSS